MVCYELLLKISIFQKILWIRVKIVVNFQLLVKIAILKQNHENINTKTKNMTQMKKSAVEYGNIALPVEFHKCLIKQLFQYPDNKSKKNFDF